MHIPLGGGGGGLNLAWRRESGEHKDLGLHSDRRFWTRISRG